MIGYAFYNSLDPEQRDLVRTAKESCEMLLRLIDDLLNFSKVKSFPLFFFAETNHLSLFNIYLTILFINNYLQAGKVSLDLSEVILEDIITDVVEMLIPMALQKRLNITYDIPSNVPPVVMADANRLRQ